MSPVLVPPPTGPVTEREYLRFEEARPDRFELWAGEPRPRADVGYRESMLNVRVGAALGAALPTPPFLHFSSQLKLRLPDRTYCYADAVVARHPLSFDPHLLDRQESDVLTNPVLLVEITSPETAHVDRGEKLDAYRTIPSLRDYLLFRPGRAPEVEYHFRHDGTVDWDSAVTRRGRDAEDPNSPPAVRRSPSARSTPVLDKLDRHPV